MTAKMTIERLGYMMRDAFGSALEWDARAKKLVEILAESECAIVAVPDREISDEELGRSQPDDITTLDEIECGAKQRKNLLAAGYHVTRVVANGDGQHVYRIALETLAMLLDVECPPKDAALPVLLLADAIRKKFAPAEADSIEEQTQKTMDEIVFESAVYEAGLDVARWIFCGEGEAYSPPSALKNRLSDAIDQESLSRGELKPRQPKKGPTFEELQARDYHIKIRKERCGFDARYVAVHEAFPMNEWVGGSRAEAAGEALSFADRMFKKIAAKGEDLPMPGEGK